MNEWKDIVENPPHKWDGDSMGNILVWYRNSEHAGVVNMAIAVSFPYDTPFWMPLPKRPKDNA